MEMNCRAAGEAVTHLAILGVDVLVVALDDGAVNEEAAHHHDHLQHLPQGDLARAAQGHEGAEGQLMVAEFIKPSS